MRWDATGYGAHTEKATSGPELRWYFAEGSQGFFSTFLLLANPQEEANAAKVTYFREDGQPVIRNYDLLPRSRKTILAGDDPDLVDQLVRHDRGVHAAGRGGTRRCTSAPIRSGTADTNPRA